MISPTKKNARPPDYKVWACRKGTNISIWDVANLPCYCRMTTSYFNVNQKRWVNKNYLQKHELEALFWAIQEALIIMRQLDAVPAKQYSKPRVIEDPDIEDQRPIPKQELVIDREVFEETFNELNDNSDFIEEEEIECD